MTQGIFRNQAMGMVPQGVFANRATGLAGTAMRKGVFARPTAGFGEVGGIFNGPTALGTALGLGAASSQNSQCKLDCVAAWSGKPDEEYNTAVCQQNCDWNYPPETTIEPESSEPEPWYGDGGGATYDASSGQACNSANVISIVQAAIGAGIDGKWGNESQTKLNAAGGEFKAFAPGCTGSVPSYTGGSTSVTPTPSTTTPAVIAPTSQASMGGGVMDFLSSKFMGVPMYGWAAGFTIVAALGITFARLQAER